MYPAPALATQEKPATAGRPRAFVPADALQSALGVFWQRGFEATSLDDLTDAMQLSRSSFYACFGSKHAVFMAAIQCYSDERFAAIQEVARSMPDPIAAVQAVLTTIADTGGGPRGCFFANSVTELAPHDPALATYCQSHIKRVLKVVTGLLITAGFKPQLAETRAGAALALAMGAITLRKAGIPAAPIRALLNQAQTLLALPRHTAATNRRGHLPSGLKPNQARPPVSTST